ncbi:MAG TPA: SCO family protein [Trebonia sp.]|nr:SCO family protein [Trebonia sp.]
MITKPRALATLAGLIALGGVALAGCTSASPTSAASAPSSASAAAATSPLSGAAEANPNIDLGSSLGNAQAPDFRLANQFGQETSLSQFRGKVVLLSFEDSECTTVCPLTTQAMVIAKELLGKAGDSVQLVGVDANPSATAVSDVMSYSRVHGMVNEWDFLTGSVAQLKKVWGAYHVAVQIEQGQIDHTPALFVINPQGQEQKVYLTQMSYSGVGQSAQVVAQEVASLLPSHPKLSSLQSLAAIPPQDPTAKATLPAAGAGTPVELGPGKPRLVVFFSSWLTEVSDLPAELKGLNAYAKAARAQHLPGLTAVDEAVTEPSPTTVDAALKAAGPLAYPVGLDSTGQLADGYGVQDQPWLVLVNAEGKVTWSHDGWLPASAIEAAAKAHS